MRKKIVPKAFRDSLAVSVLYDYQRDEPNTDVWEDWVNATAGKYKCSTDDVENALTGIKRTLDTQIRTHISSEAAKVARQVGLTIHEIVKTIQEGLKATKKTHLRDRQGGVVKSITEPDWSARKAFTEQGIKLFGIYAPQRMEITNEIGDNLADLSMAELQVEMAKTIAANPELCQLIESARGKEQPLQIEQLCVDGNETNT